MTHPLWLKIAEDKSSMGQYRIKHHSTASLIELYEQDSDGVKKYSIWLDYPEWEEFTDFINQLTKEL